MKKEILFTVGKKDLKITYFSPKSPGGQNKNKTQNAVRIYHPASGARTTGQEQRDRAQNLKAAFRRLLDNGKFKIWWQRRAWECLEGETLEQKVDREMKPENIKVEIQVDGKWVPWREDLLQKEE